VPSVFSVLKAFDFLRNSHAVKSFNTENIEEQRGNLENNRRRETPLLNFSCAF
jgi:hypothetical protein